MITFIYGLKDPRTDEVRYVGKANDVNKRYSRHICDAKVKTSCHRLAWINSLHKLSLLPILVVLEACEDTVWGEREEYWISQFPNLTNQIDGGKGNPMANPEIVAKMKATKATKPQVFSQETRAKLSLAVKARWASGNLSSGRVQQQDEIDKRTLSIKAFWKTKSLAEKKAIMPKAFVRPLKPVVQYSLSGEFIKAYPSARLASQETSVNSSNIGACCNHRKKTAGGYLWKFSSDEARDPLVMKENIN